MTVHRASGRPSAPKAYQCEITQSTGMATQMRLKVYLEGKHMTARTFRKKKTTTKSSLFRRYFLFTLTWITEKELERVIENKGDEHGHSNAMRR